MKKTPLLLSLLALLSAGGGWATVTVDPDFTITAERGSYKDYTFNALRFTSDGQGGEITLSQDGAALDLTGNGTLYGTTNADQNGMNLYFDGTGTTTITGVNLDNSKQAGTSYNVTKTYYAFVVASGGVTFDGVKGEGDSSIDLQQNLSVGTAWTNYSETPAVLTIQGGSKIETTAYYNAVGSNGSKGIINITGEGTELRTQQITLGAGLSGLTAAPSPESDALFESAAPDSQRIYWYPAYFYDETTYQQLKADSGEKMGYGTINITEGATMIVGEGNPNHTNNRLQIFNGEVNVSGENSALILSDQVHLSLDSNYEYFVRNENSTINISNGGTVKSADGVKMRTFSMGILYNGNEAYAALNVTGEGSLLDLSASYLVTIGGEDNQEGGIGQSTIAVSDKAVARIASATNIQMAVLNSEQYKVDISASSGGQLDLSAVNTVYVGGTGEGNNEFSLSADGADSQLTISGGVIYINAWNRDTQKTTINVSDKAEMTLEAATQTQLGKNTEVSVEGGATLTTIGEVLMKQNALAEVEEGSIWNAASITLQDTACITNYGTLSATSLNLGEGTSLINYGTLYSRGGAELDADSSSTFIVTQGESGSLVSTVIALENSALTLEDGAEFIIDFTALGEGGYNDITLTLITGISNTEALTDESLSTLLDNTQFQYGEGLWAESNTLTYSVSGDNLILSGSMRVVPEPATATLSLLALAALAARRRRKA